MPEYGHGLPLLVLWASAEATILFVRAFGRGDDLVCPGVGRGDDLVMKASAEATISFVRASAEATTAR
jgi:hypothetical protein